MSSFATVRLLMVGVLSVKSATEISAVLRDGIEDVQRVQ
jgi:hypothetical protein